MIGCQLFRLVPRLAQRGTPRRTRLPRRHRRRNVVRGVVLRRPSALWRTSIGGVPMVARTNTEVGPRRATRVADCSVGVLAHPSGCVALLPASGWARTSVHPTPTVDHRSKKQSVFRSLTHNDVLGYTSYVKVYSIHLSSLFGNIIYFCHISFACSPTLAVVGGRGAGSESGGIETRWLRASRPTLQSWKGMDGPCPRR